MRPHRPLGGGGADGEVVDLLVGGVQLVLDLAVQAGATPSSTETLAAESVGAYRRVGVRIALTAPWPVLVRLLQAAAEATPGLLVDDLQIRGSRLLVRPADVPLDALMTVSAFRSGAAQAAQAVPQLTAPR